MVEGGHDYSGPHPNWQSIVREYPSGPRRVYINSAGRIAQSIPQTWKMELPPIDREEAIKTLRATEHLSPRIVSSAPIVQISPRLRIMANIFDIPSPQLRVNNITSRAEAIIMQPEIFGSTTECLRDASIISLSSSVHNKGPVSTIPANVPMSSDERDVRGDFHKRQIEWEKLRVKLPESAFIKMCGGPRMWQNTPTSEAMEAINRKAIKAAGRNGSSLARDRRCLEKYEDYRSIKQITLPPFPVPPAVASNMAQYYMSTSESFASGRGTSIGPGYMAAWAHLQNHFGLEVGLEAPVADSIAKHSASGERKAEPVPLWVWDLIEGVCSSLEESPLRFYLRNLWIMIYTSTRAQDFHRAISSTKYNIPRADALMEIKITKNGEEHVVVPLVAQGLRGPISWIQEHFARIASITFSTPDFVGNIKHATKFNGKRMPSDKFSNLIPELLECVGLTKEQIKLLKITGHSSHATMDVIASVLNWNATARDDLGRWRNKGGQNVMHYRYATRASAINQMYIRATLIAAIIDIAPPPYKYGFDIENLRDSPLYPTSMYVGPFVTFSVRDKVDDPVKIDCLFAN